jgi:CBS domain containing-hemolysin-like protein
LLVAGDSSIEPVRETALEMSSRRRAPVQRAMIPFADMQWLPADATVGDLRRTLESTAHTRYPLREADGSFRRYVHFLDPFLKEAGPSPLARSARPLVELDPDCPLDEVLGLLERSSSRVGVVRGPGPTPLGFVLAGDVVATLLSLDTVDS